MSIQTVGIIGAGTMGNGIAQVAALAGLKVIVIDVNDAALAHGVATLTNSLEPGVEGKAAGRGAHRDLDRLRKARPPIL